MKKLGFLLSLSILVLDVRAATASNKAEPTRDHNVGAQTPKPKEELEDEKERDDRLQRIDPPVLTKLTHPWS